MALNFSFISKTDVTCSRCQNIYIKPKLLRCFHSFCHQCVQKQVRKVNEKLVVTCSICHDETCVNDGTCDELTTNIHMLGLVEIYQAKQTLGRKCSICSLSNENTYTKSSHMCLTCDDRLCQSCSKGHNSSSVTSSHVVATIEDITKGRFDQQLYNRQKITCELHPGEQYRFYCTDCSALVCVQCVLHDHKTHSHKSLEDIVNNKKKMLCDNLALIDVPSTDNIVTTLENNLKTLDKKEKEFESKLHKDVATLVDKIRKEEKEILEKGKKSFSEERKRTTEELEKIKMRSTSVKTVTQMCRHVTYNAGPGLMLMSKALQIGLEGLSKDSERSQTKTSSIPRLTTNVKGLLLEDDLIVLQDAGTEATNETSQVKGDRKSTYVQKNAKSVMAAPKEEILLDYSYDFLIGACKDKLASTVTSMVLHEDSIFMLDAKNKKIKIYGKNGQHKNTLSSRSTTNIPSQIAICGPLVGILGNLLIVFPSDLNVAKIQTITLNIRNADLTSSPIISRYTDENIIIANLPQNAMNIYDIHGSLKRTWTSKVPGPVVSVQYAGEDKIVMCTWFGNGAVHIESEIEGPILEIHKMVKGTRLTKWQPADACVTKAGYVIVSDSERNEVSVFSPGGSEMTVLDTREDDFTEPRCLSVHQDNLYVSGNGGLIVVYRLKCYKRKL